MNQSTGYSLFLAFILLQGHLSGYGIEEQLPTVAIVAHYDAFGIAPVSIETVIFCELSCQDQTQRICLGGEFGYNSEMTFRISFLYKNIQLTFVILTLLILNNHLFQSENMEI